MTTPPLSPWRLDGNYLLGTDFSHWWQLLQQNQFQISPQYGYRAGVITLTSILNTALSQLESHRYGAAIIAIQITEDPVFIIGHWRSGTTLLHELLALDEQFAFPNTFQVNNPQTFLCTEAIGSKWLARLVPHHRPMDAMGINFQSPQEDEFAIALTTQMSYYLALSFPWAEQHYERYLTLDGLTPDELQSWKTALLTFLKKLTYKYQRRLLLKSPPHTARIQHLLKLFPKARFIHIHRHPYEVFQSMQRYFEIAGWLTYLQNPDPDALTPAILRRYEVLYGAYLAQRHLIPQGQLCEIGFSALEADSISQVQGIYDVLSLNYSSMFETKLNQYLHSRQSYHRNTFTPLALDVKQQINQRWQPYFSEWGYEVG